MIFDTFPSSKLELRNFFQSPLCFMNTLRPNNGRAAPGIPSWTKPTSGAKTRFSGPEKCTRAVRPVERSPGGLCSRQILRRRLSGGSGALWGLDRKFDLGTSEFDLGTSELFDLRAQKSPNEGFGQLKGGLEVVSCAKSCVRPFLAVPARTIDLGTSEFSGTIDLGTSELCDLVKLVENLTKSQNYAQHRRDQTDPRCGTKKREEDAARTRLDGRAVQGASFRY